MDILRREGEEYERSGNEWRWKRHSSVTFSGSSWYRHSEQFGSHAIDFMQEFFDMSFPEAVTYLLHGELAQGKAPDPREETVKKARKRSQPKQTEERKMVESQKEEKQKVFCLPERNDTMKHAYAYLMKKRFVDREVLSYFAKQGTLYESKEHHNAVFVGVDKAGVPRHAHKKGTYSDGKSFRVNVDGSNPDYGFGYAGTGKKLFVFEAPIDLLSFLTLYPKDWQKESYIVLNGVAEHAMLQRLVDYPQIDTVVLCLDHDAAGIENNGRLAEILRKEFPDKTLSMLQSKNKDWNEDLKERNGEEPIPGQEHPKIVECQAWCEVLKEMVRNIDNRYATREQLLYYHREMYETLQKGIKLEQLEDAFDGSGLLMSGIAVKVIEQCGRELGKETQAEEIVQYLMKRYRPHQDKGNLRTRLTAIQNAFEEVMEVYQKENMDPAERNVLLTKKCMSLTMECIKAHIFVSGKVLEQKQEGGMTQLCSQ